MRQNSFWEWGEQAMPLGRLRRVTATACALLASAMLLSACASYGGDIAKLDPYEDVNRDIHEFNKGLDRYLVRPVSQAYGEMTPGLIRLLVSNALNHLELPKDFANSLLVGEWEVAAQTATRFGLNTILGAGGLLDPATDFGLPKEDRDFGMTLAHYGLAEGLYYELPLLGPTTFRDAVGRLTDLAFAPTTYVGGPVASAAVTGAGVVEFRETNAQTVDSILYDSADSYATSRAFYLQNRTFQINGGKVDTADDLDVLPE